MKKFIEERAKDIPVLDEVDVLVVGGGPSGIAAAMGAAREGVRTMLVERYGCFGGVISQVGVEGFAWYRHEGTVEAGGIAAEFEEAARLMGGATKECQSESEALDAEMFKCVADKLVLEAGVIPLFYCFASEAIVNDGQIQGIIVDGKSGRQAILAKRVIDCTGDADVAALAGAPFTKREHLCSVTPLFNVRGVDSEKFQNYIENDLKPTYSDWRGEWEMTTNGKEDDMFSPYLVAPFRKAIEDGVLDKEDDVDYGGSYSTVTKEGEVLQLKEQIYIKTARKLGKSNLYIAMKHMVPHLLPQFIVGLVLLFPHAILHESGITFLGFGLSNEQPAIGIILSEAMKYLATGKWWLALFPGIMLILTVVCFYTTGENLRRLLDPASAHE